MLQMVSEPTLAVARTGQCAGIGRMARVGRLGHTAWHMGRHWTYGRALRENVPGHLLGSVRGHVARVGRVGHTAYGPALDG